MNNQTQAEQGEWITPDEAAKIIGIVTKKTISRWCREGWLPCQQINQRWYINKIQLLNLLRSPKRLQKTPKGT